MGAPAVRPFLPVDAQPLQVFDHGVREFWATPLRVEIFVTQDENAITFASPLGCDQKRSCMTEVQISRGRRSESTSIGVGEIFYQAFMFACV